MWLQLRSLLLTLQAVYPTPAFHVFALTMSASEGAVRKRLFNCFFWQTFLWQLDSDVLTSSVKGINWCLALLLRHIQLWQDFIDVFQTPAVINNCWCVCLILQFRWQRWEEPWRLPILRCLLPVSMVTDSFPQELGPTGASTSTE